MKLKIYKHISDRRIQDTNLPSVIRVKFTLQDNCTSIFAVVDDDSIIYTLPSGAIKCGAYERENFDNVNMQEREF